MVSSIVPRVVLGMPVYIVTVYVKFIEFKVSRLA